MNNTNWKTYYAGLGIYAICIGIAALPILSKGLSLTGGLEILGAATLASLFIAIYRGSRLSRQLKDSNGVFLQAVFGILVCGGLYSLVSDTPRPEVIFTVFLLWTAVGLMHLTPGRVVTLYVIALGIFADSFPSTLFMTSVSDTHAEAIYMMVLSTVMAGFMYWRALDYTRVRNEKAQLKEENSRQAGEIEEAKRRIHTLTVQDMDTIALKYPFFKQELQRCKERAERSGDTFAVGLVSIDHFAELSRRHGETAMKQLNREVVLRVSGIVSKMNVEGGRHPGVGKVGDGLFGIILDRTNLRGARVCTERLHMAISHQMVRTMAGPLDVTVTVGFAEYFSGESVDELMEQVGEALEKARLQEVEELQVEAKRPWTNGKPVKLATGAHDMRLLHEKEYGSPVH
ncbi:MAG TPA: GGDEF domain-containing protein [Gammaproteobacteria bacterium]|nr:GGDEF domain-containing protein [Gammaproteobacteria bacterium]